MPFDGETYEREHDFARLTTQLERVEFILKLGGAWTLSQLHDACGGSEAGISARIRDLRKEKFGGHEVQRRRRGDPKQGLWEYWIQRGTLDLFGQPMEP